jgi:hypothetical protein
VPTAARREPARRRARIIAICMSARRVPPCAAGLSDRDSRMLTGGSCARAHHADVRRAASPPRRRLAAAQRRGRDRALRDLLLRTVLARERPTREPTARASRASCTIRTPPSLSERRLHGATSAPTNDELAASPLPVVLVRLRTFCRFCRSYFALQYCCRLASVVRPDGRMGRSTVQLQSLAVRHPPVPRVRPPFIRDSKSPFLLSTTYSIL